MYFGENLIPASLCIKCKGRLWCKLPTCPILEKFQAKQEVVSHVKGNKFEGFTPPANFVSWKNYPKVSIGPLAASFSQTEQSEDPQKLFGKPQDHIMRLRSGLIHSSLKMDMKTAQSPSRELSELQDLSLSVEKVDAEFSLKKSPKAFLSFSDTSAPFGASAELSKIKLSENPKIPAKVDSFVEDKNTKAIDAITNLFDAGLPVHYLYRILSAGTLGVQKKRKLTPTRWSITAIDSNVSEFLIDESVKNQPEIGEIELYSHSYAGNHFFVALVPREWSFEMLECWLPGAGWALDAGKDELNVLCDYEFYNGRKTYADNITGAYYAARLAVAEHLSRRKRTASAIVIREITPDYSVPLGVWVIRETVRKALSKKPLLFSELNLCLDYAKARLSVPLEKYLSSSVLLPEIKKQSKITKWL